MGDKLLTNILKISDTTKKEFSELIFFQLVKKNMKKIFPCWFKESFEPFNKFPVHKCCDTELFKHLSNPAFCSL